MKPFLKSRLDQIDERLAQLDFLLSREDIMSVMGQFMKLSREHAEIASVSARYAI